MRALDRVVLLVLGVGVLALVLGLRAAPAQDGGDRIASIDVLSLVEQKLRTPEYEEVRTAREAELIEILQGMQAEIQLLSQQLQTMQPGDPQGQQVYAEFQAKQMEMQQFQQTSLDSFQQMGADQAKEVYALVRAATDRVAQREGVTHVIASRAGVDMPAANSLTAVTQEILARPLTVGMDRHDLTDAVRTELGLPDPSEANAEEAADAVEESAEEAGETMDQPAP